MVHSIGNNRNDDIIGHEIPALHDIFDTRPEG